MVSNIYFFSSTGNSLVVARDLAGELGDSKIIPVPEAVLQPEISLDAEVNVVVFPVYIWGLPRIISSFIRKIKNPAEKRIYAVATFGGFPAGTLNQLEEELKAAGASLSAGFAIRMPGNYTPMYGAHTEEKQRKCFVGEKEQIKGIAKYIKEKKRGRFDKNNFIVNWIFSSFIYKKFMSKVFAADAKYWVNDKCFGCGLCAKVCPVKNIKIQGEKPVWFHNCEHCLACLQWCPVFAIEFGKSTAGRKRYHHPDVKVSDFEYLHERRV